VPFWGSSSWGRSARRWSGRGDASRRGRSGRGVAARVCRVVGDPDVHRSARGNDRTARRNPPNRLPLGALRGLCPVRSSGGDPPAGRAERPNSMRPAVKAFAGLDVGDSRRGRVVATRSTAAIATPAPRCKARRHTVPRFCDTRQVMRSRQSMTKSPNNGHEVAWPGRTTASKRPNRRPTGQSPPASPPGGRRTTRGGPG
jgi:hypothetical protein